MKKHLLIFSVQGVTRYDVIVEYLLRHGVFLLLA